MISELNHFFLIFLNLNYRISSRMNSSCELIATWVIVTKSFIWGIHFSGQSFLLVPFIFLHFNLRKLPLDFYWKLSDLQLGFPKFISKVYFQISVTQWYYLGVFCSRAVDIFIFWVRIKRPGQKCFPGFSFIKGWRFLNQLYPTINYNQII